MTDIYCGPYKYKSTREMTAEEKQMVLALRKKVQVKFIIGILLVVLSVPVTLFVAWFLNKNFQLETAGLVIMMFGFFLGIPAGILVFKDNFRYWRQVRRSTLKIEEYTGTVDEQDMEILSQIHRYLENIGEPISIMMVSGTEYVFSIDGKNVLKENLLIERAVVSRGDIPYAIAISDENLEENQTLEKRHMSDDEVEEVSLLIKKNKKYFSFWRVLSLFFGGFYVVTLFKMGFSAFFLNNIYFGLMGGFWIVVTIVDHLNYWTQLRLNARLKEDIAAREVWILRTKYEDGEETVEEALMFSNLLWTSQGEPLPWRVFKTRV